MLLAVQRGHGADAVVDHADSRVSSHTVPTARPLYVPSLRRTGDCTAWGHGLQTESPWWGGRGRLRPVTPWRTPPCRAALVPWQPTRLFVPNPRESKMCCDPVRIGS